MRNYQLFKILGNGNLEPYGSYEARTGQGAIKGMIKRDNLENSDYAASFHAIPFGKHFRKLRP